MLLFCSIFKHLLFCEAEAGFRGSLHAPRALRPSGPGWSELKGRQSMCTHNTEKMSFTSKAKLRPGSSVSQRC